MGVAGAFFEPHPCNFGKLDIFSRCSNDTSDIPYGDRLAKNVKSRCVQIIPRSAGNSGYVELNEYTLKIECFLITLFMFYKQLL